MLLLNISLYYHENINTCTCIHNVFVLTAKLKKIELVHVLQCIES